MNLVRSFSSNTIVNIARAELVTQEATPRVLCFDTVTSAEPEPFISEGGESELRVRNTILAQDCLEDILKGYNIKLKDCVLSRGLLELIDGGLAADAAEGSFAGYTSPAAGSVSARTRFTLRLYTEEKDYSGQTVGCFRLSFPNCVGTPAKFKLENGSFTAPEYTVRSRPASGGSALSIESLDSLPILCAAQGDVPEAPAEGVTIVAAVPITVGETALGVGQTACMQDGEWVIFN